MTTSTIKRDISKPKDIHRIVDRFFKKVNKDSLLAPYFADKTPDEWDAFLPVMYSFWENVLFYSGGYTGNPMQRHKEMNDMKSFSQEHFTRWITLMCEVIDKWYAGEKAEMMKERARNIATIMQVKIGS
ncbi:MAG TPA: group III truncated hemoglobin [Saprospiraceae bacterium]|nr:group III truncated hemoglobin [Saprospiraceae bacterium]